jgi:hypothetical protein
VTSKKPENSIKYHEIQVESTPPTPLLNLPKGLNLKKASFMSFEQDEPEPETPLKLEGKKKNFYLVFNGTEESKETSGHF